MTAVAEPSVRLPLSDLPGIDLDELVERAALQTRTDRKYILPVTRLAGFLADIAGQSRVLEIDGVREFGYESTYFDTPDLASYLLTAYRRRRRFKVRTRTYLDSWQCWLEVKTRGQRGSTVKQRRPHPPEQPGSLGAGREFVNGVLAEERFTVGEDTRFAPLLHTRYRRSTLFLPAAVARVTVDTNLLWRDDRHELYLPELAIIETKTGSTASDVDKLLWRAGHRPVRISKFATGLAALRPDLPATPWRRTLRRHFPAVPAAAGFRTHRWLTAS